MPEERGPRWAVLLGCGHLNVIWGRRSRAQEQALEERVGLGQPSGKGGQVVGVGYKRSDEGGRVHLIKISGSGSGAGRRD